MKLEEKSKIFKALSDEKRIDILQMIKDGEKCACFLIEKLDIAQSKLSYHMSILCKCGIVNAKVSGKWTYYSINKDGIELAKSILDSLL